MTKNELKIETKELQSILDKAIEGFNGFAKIIGVPKQVKVKLTVKNQQELDFQTKRVNLYMKKLKSMLNDFSLEM